MARAKVLTYQPTRATCELRDDWRSWSQAKREDGLFMSCPRCGVYGSHIGEAAGSREGSEEVRGMADHMHGCICLECQVDAEEGRPPCRLCSCRGVEDGPCDCECHGPRVLEDYPEPPDRWKEDEEL